MTAGSHQELQSGDFSSRRQSSFSAIRSVLSEENFTGALRCATKIRAELSDQRQLENNVVLVAYGGGKDSSYTLAFVRAMQLLLFQIYGTTFTMRVVTNRHAGMPSAVMENIDRAYTALDLYDDPQCQLLLIDGYQVRPFDVALPQADDVVLRNRTDILMTGHRTFADARPTFCNACNLSMVNSFGLAASIDGGVDLIITGDSQREQRDYYLWVNRLARRFGVTPGSERKIGFRGFLVAADTIAKTYFADIHGDDAAAVDDHRIVTEVPEDLRFFSIYDDTGYASGGHWKLLTEFLGFQFDDIAFSFTESDCGNPALMAHLRGLKSEHVHQRSYVDGLSEYVQFALSLMQKKEFPNKLVDTMRERYGDESAMVYMRKEMNAYAEYSYNLNEEQLVCMVYSPFAGQGAGLDGYLRREQPTLRGHLDAVHQVLAGPDAGRDSDAAQDLITALERISGLSIGRLRVLYSSPLRPPSATANDADLLGAILQGDPHKDVISTRHAPDGPVVLELLSGR